MKTTYIPFIGLGIMLILGLMVGVGYAIGASNGSIDALDDQKWEATGGDGVREPVESGYQPPSTNSAPAPTITTTTTIAAVTTTTTEPDDPNADLVEAGRIATLGGYLVWDGERILETGETDHVDLPEAASKARTVAHDWLMLVNFGRPEVRDVFLSGSRNFLALEGAFLDTHDWVESGDERALADAIEVFSTVGDELQAAYDDFDEYLMENDI